MRHLLIPIWIKMLYNQNTFTSLEVSDLTIFDQKKFQHEKKRSPSRTQTHDLKEFYRQHSDPLRYAYREQVWGKKTIMKLYLISLFRQDIGHNMEAYHTTDIFIRSQCILNQLKWIKIRFQQQQIQIQYHFIRNKCFIKPQGLSSNLKKKTRI